MNVFLGFHRSTFWTRSCSMKLFLMTFPRENQHPRLLLLLMLLLNLLVLLIPLLITFVVETQKAKNKNVKRLVSSEWVQSPGNHSSVWP